MYRVGGVAAQFVRRNIIPGALRIPSGAVPVFARGLKHTAPTYIVGSPGLHNR